MGQQIYIIVYLVLCVPIIIKAKEQFEYKYTGSVIGKNKATDKGFSKWSLSADLVVQKYDDHNVLKLNNIKTALFNGPDTIQYPEEKEPLANVTFLTTPFGMYYDDENDVQITTEYGEPTWSLNMKKSIASILHIDFKVSSGTEAVELTLYGNCIVNFEVKETESMKYIDKVIHHENCSYPVEHIWRNVDLKHNHNTRKYETKRFYEFEKNYKHLTYIRAESNFTYQNMPIVKTTHHLIQKQEFVLLSSTTVFTPFEIPDETDKEYITWENYEEEKYSDLDEIDVYNEYVNSKNEYIKSLHERPLKNMDVNFNDTINEMFAALGVANFKQLTDILDKDKNFMNLHDIYIYYSLLPYIGTNNTLEVIYETVKRFSEKSTIMINDLLIIKMLATFPMYVNNPNQENLKKFKFLMNWDSLKKTPIKHAGILSYAALVADTYQRSDIKEKFLSKITQKYYNRLHETNSYEEQMTYLLGLINLGNCVLEETMLDVITDQNLSDNLRVLATFGFKSYLVNPIKEDVFKTMWPVIQNTEENFEVKAAALDLLLSSNLTQERFDIIIDAYEKKPENQFEEHLSNYVFTTLQSHIDSTASDNSFAKFASERLNKKPVPRYTRSWTTGNYRLAFSDEQANYGASLQARLIGSPVSNGLNIIHLSYEHFEMSFALESYSVYLRIGGVFDNLFLQFLDSRNNDAVSNLVDILKTCECKIKDGEDINVDLALFSGTVAVFGIHLSKTNIFEFRDSPLLEHLSQYLVYHQTISFPVMYFGGFPSDFGTNLAISEETQQSSFLGNDIYNQLISREKDAQKIKIYYKTTQLHSTIVKCNNPLVKSSITVYKGRRNEKLFVFPLKINTTSFDVLWKFENDMFNWVSDNLMGTTSVYEEVLKHYCPDCIDYFQVPIGSYNNIDVDLHELGIKLNLTRTESSEELKAIKNMEPRTKSAIDAIQNSHRSNAFAFPAAKPFLYLWHLTHYMNAVNELESINIRTSRLYDFDYMGKIKFNLDADSITNDNDPLDGAELQLSILYTHEKLDGQVLGGVNTTFKVVSTTQSAENETKPHVVHKFDFYFDTFTDDGNYTKICINREMLYPSKRSDKLSLKSVKPATGKMTVAWGEVDSLNECPKRFFKFTELYTATDVQNSKAEESEEYKQCKKDSTEHKYIPPTPACIAAHDALSKYDLYGIYVDLKHSGKYQVLEDRMESSKLGYKVMEYNHIDDGHINISIARGWLDEFITITNSKFLNYEENSAFFDFLSVDPTAVAYDDYDVFAGIASTCVITPTTLTTFAGVREPIFDETSSQEIIAFVECINKTSTGLTVQKINNKFVGFKLWSGENILDVTVNNAKMVVELNGEKVTQTPETQDENLTIYFLEDDILFVVDTISEIYYTTEYISIKSISFYNKYICGKCSYKH